MDAASHWGQARETSLFLWIRGLFQDSVDTGYPQTLENSLFLSEIIAANPELSGALSALSVFNKMCFG